MRWRRCPVAALVGFAALPGAAAAASLRFHSNSRATFQSPGGWDEPSGIGSSAGHLFVASQNPNATPDVTLSQSADGLSWSADASYTTYLSGRAEGQTGDVTMTSDRAGTVFLGHLTGALQADIDWST